MGEVDDAFGLSAGASTENANANANVREMGEQESRTASSSRSYMDSCIATSLLGRPDQLRFFALCASDSDNHRQVVGHRMTNGCSRTLTTQRILRTGVEGSPSFWKTPCALVLYCRGRSRGPSLAHRSSLIAHRCTNSVQCVSDT